MIQLHIPILNFVHIKPRQRTDKTDKRKEQGIRPKRIQQRGHQKTTLGQK